jgi:NAD-dependent dihydropyrimidine dehydrogenase PreA subunit
VTPEAKDPDYKLMGLGGPGLIETGGWGNVRFAHSVLLLKAMHRWQTDLAEKWFPSLGFPVTRVWTTPAALPKDARPEENLAEIMKKAGAWGVSTCSCRLPHWIADPGHHCTQELETCLFMGEMAKWGSENGMCRLITYDEALEVVHRSNRNGLVHTHDPAEFLCNCCRDCCIFFVSLRLTGTLPLEPSEYVAVVDEETCSACSDCVDRCPVEAIAVDDVAVIDAGKCLGCGVCFPACPSKSVKFVRRTAVRDPGSGAADHLTTRRL